MSTPSIPGYIGASPRETLADFWQRPAGDFPDALWPAADLRTVVRNPVGWLTVEEHFFTNEKHGGTGCVLAHPETAPGALDDTSWIGRDLGTVTIWNGRNFDNGLSEVDRDVEVEFFVQGHRPSGAQLPVIDISHPFLWYWDAFPVADGWKYLNRAGREQDLIRLERDADSWKIEVRALEFRQFLAAYGRTAIVQHDYVTKMEHEHFPRVDDEYRAPWAYFDFHVLNDRAMGDRPAFSRVVGQYLVTGLRNSRVPRIEERHQAETYPTFIYGVDSDTGQPLTHICDPDQLGTYFDRDGTRLHYLTPVYFKREVLQPYASEPRRYHVSASRLSCLDLWGVAISFNSAGLVEVYLGDLGRDLPPDEWGHWRTYNVPPEGIMDEGRFRRDFLNQWASSKDIVGDLRRARDDAMSATSALMGTPVWRPLDADTQAEFDSLVGPLTDDPASLGPSLLLLAKVLIDGIDPAPLKRYLTTYEKGEKSLRLLSRYATAVPRSS